MKYEFILDNPEYPVSRWAARLQINKSGYYAWRKVRESRKGRQEAIKARIREEFEKSEKSYGVDRIVAELRKKGEKLGRRRCGAYMREMGLKSIHSRRRTRSLTDSRKARGEGYPNILRDECFPIVPRMGLVSDITYLRTGEGFMYYFFATMKKELIHWSFYRTKESIRSAVFQYVNCFYNGTRIQKRLGYLSPRQYFNSMKWNGLAKKSGKMAA